METVLEAALEVQRALAAAGERFLSPEAVARLLRLRDER